MMNVAKSDMFESFTVLSKALLMLIIISFPQKAAYFWNSIMLFIFVFYVFNCFVYFC